MLASACHGCSWMSSGTARQLGDISNRALVTMRQVPLRMTHQPSVPRRYILLIDCAFLSINRGSRRPRSERHAAARDNCDWSSARTAISSRSSPRSVTWGHAVGVQYRDHLTASEQARCQNAHRRTAASSSCKRRLPRRKTCE